MKYLKYAIIIIAILIFGFLLLGFIKPELSYDCEIMVEKPLAESWAVSQDEAKMSEWLDGLQKIEHVSGTPGKVGAVSDVYFNTDGQEMTVRETITKIVPDESISMSFDSDFMNMDYTLKMSSVNGKTKINTSTTARGNGMFAKSLMVLISGTLKDQEDTNLDNLKRTIENNSKKYNPAVKPTIESNEY